MDDDPDDELEEQKAADLDPEEEAPFEKDHPITKGTAFSKIPLTIHIEMGRFSLSLEELEKIHPGYKLPLEINPQIVHLTMNGKTFGRGEIVEVGKTIGVRILELYQ